MVEHGDCETIGCRILALGDLVFDLKRVCFIRQRGDHVEFFPAFALETFDQRKSVHGVTDVDEEGQQGDFEQGKPRVQNIDCGELHASGEDGYAHQQAPERAETGLGVEENSECTAHREVSREDRQRGNECGFEYFFRHKETVSLLFRR